MLKEKSFQFCRSNLKTFHFDQLFQSVGHIEKSILIIVALKQTKYQLFSLVNDQR